MKPLTLDVAMFNSPEGIPAFIERNLARGLEEFKPALCVNDGTFVICGAGPSLSSFANEIRAEREMNRPICAAKGAHDWLIENGLAPDLFVSIEPRDRLNNLKLDSDRTIYLLASRCSPAVFDYIIGKEKPLMIWNAASCEEENAVFRKHQYRTLIGGLSTSGLRAVNIGYMLGFRKFVMYGMDSCNAADGVTKRVDGSQSGQTIDVTVGGPGGRTFICNVAMAKQAQDYNYLFTMMPDITVDIKGDGLLAAMESERRKMRDIRLSTRIALEEAA